MSKNLSLVFQKTLVFFTIGNLLLAVFWTALAGCKRDRIKPFNWATGQIVVNGERYNSALIVQISSGSIRVVGGVVSDAPLGRMVIGKSDDSGKFPIQLMPSRGAFIKDGVTYSVDNDGILIWVIDGVSYRQDLVGFPPEAEIQLPHKETPDNDSLKNLQSEGH